jgi:hypothetical protein
MSGLNVSDVVNVDVTISPTAAAERNFGRLLILGTSPVIDTTERLRYYGGIEDVATDFGNAPEYLAAVVYFEQSPQPLGVYIGRWAQAATSAVLHCGVLTAAQQVLANFTAVTSGGLKITIDGTLKSLTGINLSAAGNLNAVAAAITTGLAGAGVCTWNASLQRFDVTSSTTGVTSTITAMSAPSAGTDISTLLAGTAAAASAPVAGIAAETLVAAEAIFANQSNDWYGLEVTSTTTIADDDKVALAQQIEASSVSRIVGFTITSTTVLDPTNTSDLAYRLKALNLKRTFTQYSSSNAYAVGSIFGRAFTVDFTGQNTTITLKFKQEPGITAETLTESQAKALQAKNCNVFVNYNNATAILQEGVMANGYFFDEVHGLDWLQNDIQTNLYNELYLSTTKIAQTDAGVHRLVTVCEKRLLQAARNGLLAAGEWDGPAIGAINTGDYLSKGFYAYAPLVSSQSSSDRGARKAPTIQIAAKLAGAVHFANVQVNVNR